MRVIDDTITLDELKAMRSALSGDMVKAVVDISRELVALDSELHADLAAFLIRRGSRQRDLWGVNFYPDLAGDDFVSFDSMINVRRFQGNDRRNVDDPNVRDRIIEIIGKRISR